jgi:hypothetical protein
MSTIDRWLEVSGDEVFLAEQPDHAFLGPPHRIKVRVLALEGNNARWQAIERNQSGTCAVHGSDQRSRIVEILRS